MTRARLRAIPVTLQALLVSVLGTGVARADEEQPAEARQTGHGPTLASIETSYYDFTDLLRPEEGTFEEQLQVSMVVTSVDARAPVPFRDDELFFVPSLFFEQAQLRYRKWDYDVTPRPRQPRTFYALGLGLAMVGQLTEQAWLTTEIRWGIYSDLHDVDGDADRLHGNVVFSWYFQDGTMLGGGISYNSDFGAPTPVPVLVFSLRRPWLRVDMELPSWGHILFVLHERLEVGPRGQLSGNQYRMGEPAAQRDELLIQLSTLDLGLTWNTRLVAGLWLDLFAGGAVRNRYDAVPPVGPSFDIGFRATWFCSARLEYRL